MENQHYESTPSKTQYKTPTQSLGGKSNPLKKRSIADSLRFTNNRVFAPHIYGFFLAALHLLFSFVVTAFALTFLNSNMGLQGDVLPRNLVMLGMVLIPLVASLFVFVSATTLFNHLQKRFQWIMKDDHQRRVDPKHYRTSPAV